jgi:hypothetical protein
VYLLADMVWRREKEAKQGGKKGAEQEKCEGNFR